MIWNVVVVVNSAMSAAASAAFDHRNPRLMASGVYDIPNIQVRFDSVATNTTPTAALRGAGRPEATQLLERAVELFAADILIIAAGMINFGIPSSLKAYIDYVVRPGVTFRYGSDGPEGLVKAKKAYLVLARGGRYTEGPMQAFNFQDTYLKAALGFIGITDVEVIAVEGVAFGPEVAEKAYDSALARVDAIAP